MSQYRIGTSGWIYAGWRGRFYPEDCPQSRWLEYYVKHFNTVELNATFYRFFKDETFANWYQRAPAGFEYVVKVPGYITHRKQLLDANDQITTFCHKASLLKRKLGLMLLQLSPRTPYDLDRLEEKLIAFGSFTRKLVVEFRHEKWLTDDAVALLRKYKAIYCNIDSPIAKLQTIVTAKTAYIRMHGRKKMYAYNYSTKELEEIAEQAYELTQLGANKVYAFFNNDVNANSIRNALELKQILEVS